MTMLTSVVSVSDIPLLASQAAFELDQVLRGKQSNIESAKLLGEYIKGSVSSSAPTNSRFNNSSSENLLYLALSESGAEPLQTMEYLLKRLLKWLEILNSLIHLMPKRSLQYMRKFCVALAQAALAQKKNLSDLQPKPSYYR